MSTRKYESKLFKTFKKIEKLNFFVESNALGTLKP